MGNEIKHSKYRNTMFLYEILMNKVTNAIMQNQDRKLSKLKYIIGKFFKPGTQLNKQLKLYRDIVDDQKPLKQTVDNYKININTKKLEKQKYNLVRQILNQFPDFKIYIKQTVVPNYKLYASIYKLFSYYGNKNVQYKSQDNKLSQQKLMVLQHKNKNQQNYTMKKFQQANNRAKILIYKLVLQRFNKKYQNMLPSQKRLLYYYLNNNNYNIVKMANKLYQKFNILQQCENQVIKSKVQQVVKKLKHVLTKKTTKINQNHLKFLLLYLDLLHQIKKIK